ncbi:MAG: nickel-dependent hydrogenase large subunit [Candidatus Nezhaarchaeota archaeon]|nr:nickel-dependent hydrogenase large subunit [Candidatus Nezhaarchaeota archaeon]
MSSIDLVIGPQHPALHEPERFVFKVEGEAVVDVDVKMGYVHRGIEKALEGRDFVRGVYLAERICGICNVAHSLCYVQAIEDVCGIEPPRRALFLRTVAHELNRIHSHMLLLGVAGELLGFTTLFMLLWRDRELVMDLFERLTGNRINSGFNIVGGVRRDVDDRLVQDALKAMDRLKEQFKKYRVVFAEDPTLRARTCNVGVLSQARAIELCAVGPVARASGVEVDIRRDLPYAAYEELDFKPVFYEEGDVWARLMVRVDEAVEAMGLVSQCLKKLPSGPVKVRAPRVIPAGEGFSVIEAPRGDLNYHVYGRGSPTPDRVKVRTPTYANMPAVCEMLKGGYIADIPATLVSIDPCFSCSDRVAIVNVEDGHREVATIYELAKRRGNW